MVGQRKFKPRFGSFALGIVGALSLIAIVDEPGRTFHSQSMVAEASLRCAVVARSRSRLIPYAAGRRSSGLRICRCTVGGATFTHQSHTQCPCSIVIGYTTLRMSEAALRSERTFLAPFFSTRVPSVRAFVLAPFMFAVPLALDLTVWHLARAEVRFAVCALACFLRACLCVSVLCSIVRCSFVSCAPCLLDSDVSRAYASICRKSLRMPLSSLLALRLSVCVFITAISEKQRKHFFK